MKKPLLALLFLLLICGSKSYKIVYRVVKDNKYSDPKTEIIAAENKDEAEKLFRDEHSDEEVNIMSCGENK